LEFSVTVLIIMVRRILALIVAALAFLASPSGAHAQQAAQPVQATASDAAPNGATTGSLAAAAPSGTAPLPSGNPSAAAPSQTPARSTYNSVRVDGPYLAMTFDDGPDPKLTPRLLDILKERRIHATFFLVGKMAEAHPEIVQREIAEGHEVGNHTWDHLPLPKVVQKEGGLNHEIGDTSTLIKQIIGHAPSIMRPPYGATNPRLSQAIEKEYGMKVILWSVDPFDWKNPGPQIVQNRILNGWKEGEAAKPGSIILAHDIHKGTIEAMPATLDALLAKGYRFVTVSELLEMARKPAVASATPTAVTPPPALPVKAN
jgi:peptidoglycan-N-acetylglucosamine deacetylase